MSTIELLSGRQQVSLTLDSLQQPCCAPPPSGGQSPTFSRSPDAQPISLTEGISTRQGLSGHQALRESIFQRQAVDSSQSVRLDPASENILANVHPALASRVRQMAADLARQGINISLSEGVRSFERQNELYAQGRTAPGPVVTGVPAGHSYHNYGLAVDIYPAGANGRPNFQASAEVQRKIGEAGERAGLEWGGRWTSPYDPPHFQLTGGRSASSYLPTYNEGGLPAVWDQVSRAVGDSPAPTNPRPAPSSSPGANRQITLPTGELDRGDRGQKIRQLQEALKQLGYMTQSQIDTGPGVFGPRTEAALERFQREHRDAQNRRLEVDGIYGPLTRGAMQQALNRQSAPTTPTVPGGGTNPSNGGINLDDIVGVRGNPNVTPEFRKELTAMAQRLGAKPEHLMAVMSFETGGTFSPSVRNGQSGATGLIQFLPRTAEGLGTSVGELSRMSATEQLRYVEKYFEPYKGQLGTLEGAYTAVLSGRPRPNPSDVLFNRGTAAYSQNSGLDFNSDGRITSGEATSAVASRMFGGVRNVQQKLKDAGFDPQGVDGQFGPRTSRALADFQRARGLPPTGLLDEATGRALTGNSATQPTTPTAPTRPIEPPAGDNNSRVPSGRPAAGPITSDFGPRTAPVPGASTNHGGVDIGAPTGARVQATAPGVVEHAGPLGTAGNAVIIDHGNGYKTYFFHLSQTDVRAGERVGDNQKIGEVGSTGNVSGPHLHYEVRRNGQKIDPERFF